MSLSPITPLALLALLLPFEPLEPIIRLPGMELSWVELAAATLLLLAVVSLVREAHPPVPLGVAATLFLVICFLSTLQSIEPRILPLKASLRVLAGVVAFLVTSSVLEKRSRFVSLFAAFAGAGITVSVIGLGERAQWPELSGFLALFREQTFEVGGQPRIAATFSYPNVLGGFLVAVLPTVLFFRSSRPRLVAVGATAMYSTILLTQSRGALLGVLAASCLLWFFRREDRYLTWLHVGFAAVTAMVFLAEPAFRWRATSESDRTWYEARIEPLERTLSLASGELARTRVRIANTGRLTWASDGAKPIHLSYRWFRATSPDSLSPLTLEGERTRLEHPLAPGESLVVSSTVRAPERDGHYLLVWDMVHEHTTWFSDKVGLGTPVSVSVGRVASTSFAPGAASVARAWRPGRLELWAAALELFRSSPLLGVGPDNFRWLYGPAAGKSEWDTRTFANSLYLETLATTGVAGAGALALVLGGALYGLARRPLDPIAVTLLCSLCGLLVHGLFDYLLEATPMYLTFWMILGAASARIRGVNWA